MRLTELQGHPSVLPRDEWCRWVAQVAVEEELDCYSFAISDDMISAIRPHSHELASQSWVPQLPFLLFLAHGQTRGSS
eukprot:CAMPEP_0181181110 /NCGR_PEP_ID=MMETSP1096-20121128/7163_1 /TAXON_ID=156174 ORGANISM="Chrysochromulina ericina, Strain CCMP281" /NCGR_SAMPLE_ID=MMETSP1096 /ASSEMBLY_ACC=CAM_ASM_000453 /LENGTH=77 /DNA_ID=CAMNT_0023269593 /DNA_START=112 /DNA_END=345 /DNA_ORIENTATION=+